MEENKIKNRILLGIIIALVITILTIALIIPLYRNRIAKAQEEGLIFAINTIINEVTQCKTVTLSEDPRIDIVAVQCLEDNS